MCAGKKRKVAGISEKSTPRDASGQKDMHPGTGWWVYRDGEEKAAEVVGVVDAGCGSCFLEEWAQGVCQNGRASGREGGWGIPTRKG